MKLSQYALSALSSLYLAFAPLNADANSNYLEKINLEKYQAKQAIPEQRQPIHFLPLELIIDTDIPPPLEITKPASDPAKINSPFPIERIRVKRIK